MTFPVGIPAPPVYATRNDAFSPAVVWRLEGGNLWIESGTAPLRVVNLSAVREVRLEFAPTRPERNRYRCQLRLRNGATETIFNRTYRGVMDFLDTSEAYRTFVPGVLSAVAKHAPACRFLAGATPANYALGVAGFIFTSAVLALILGILVIAGLWWWAVVKVGLIAFYLPTAWRWLRRNRELRFDPDKPPMEVLPEARAAR